MSVQILRLPGRVTVRDSADPGGPRLWFSVAEWAEFVDSVKRHRLSVAPPATGRLSFPDGPLYLPPLPQRRRLPLLFVDPDITGMGRPPLAPKLTGRR